MNIALRTTAARYFSGRRFLDVLVLQGTPLLGAAFAMSHLRAIHLATVATLLAGNLFLMAHIFMLNDWAGLEHDLADPNRAPKVFAARGIATTEMAAMAGGLLIASLVFFSCLGRTALAIAVAIATLSALYSLPPFRWKGIPIVSSAVHLCGGFLHFLLGYSVGHAIDRRGAAIALYFALIFVAGHLTHEVRDHAADARNRIATNAATFGPRRMFALSLLLFASAHVIFFRLAYDSMIPRPLAATVALFLLQIYWSFGIMRDGLTYASVSRLQARYRVLYGVIGVCILAALII